MKSVRISRVIADSPETVTAFAAEPDNLPRWAAGLASSEVRRVGNELLMESPMGTLSVTFVPRNQYGIIDHDVRLPTGEVVNNPVRVISHPDGAEIIFTLR